MGFMCHPGDRLSAVVAASILGNLPAKPAVASRATIAPALC
jgi:hypothetical protein